MIEFILSATKHSLWDSTFLFLLATKIVELQILCPLKNKLIIRNYNVVIKLSLPLHKTGKNIGLKESHRQSSADCQKYLCNRWFISEVYKILIPFPCSSLYCKLFNLFGLFKTSPSNIIQKYPRETSGMRNTKSK